MSWEKLLTCALKFAKVKEKLEAVSRMSSVKKCTQKFCKIQRETPMPDSLI